MSLLEWCQWLQNSSLGTSIRESGYTYPLIEGTHVLGLALSVGTIMWFDLRLLGLAMRRDAVSKVFAQVQPWMLAGFAIMFTTGALLFTARAEDAYNSTYFRIKAGLLVLGAVNVLVFHATVDRQRAAWDVGRPPFRARMAGLISLVLWFGIIAAGRIMAYNL